MDGETKAGRSHGLLPFSGMLRRIWAPASCRRGGATLLALWSERRGQDGGRRSSPECGMTQL